MFELFPVAAFLGLGIGVALSYIAPEELHAGKRFFELTRKIILILLMVSIAFGLRSGQSMFLLFSLMALVLIVINVLWSRLWMEWINYLFVFAVSIFIAKPLLAASVLFLYSLPVGTLVRMAYQKQEG